MPTFEQLLNQYLTDFQAQFPDADISQGSLIYAKGCAIASLVFGLYQYQENIDANNLPDTSDSAGLLAWASNLPITVAPGETDSDILASILNFLQKPPAGGNLNDYAVWAVQASPSQIASAIAYDNGDAQGLGTVDVVVTALSTVSPFDGTVTSDICTAVRAYILTQRQAGSSTLRVLSIVNQPENVTMTVTGPANLGAIQAQVIAYLNSLPNNATLAIAQLQSIAINNGATNAVVSVPSADVVPPNKQTRITAGTVSVNA